MLLLLVLLVVLVLMQLLLCWTPSFCWFFVFWGALAWVLLACGLETERCASCPPHFCYFLRSPVRSFEFGVSIKRCGVNLNTCASTKKAFSPVYPALPGCMNMSLFWPLTVFFRFKASCSCEGIPRSGRPGVCVWPQRHPGHTV